MADYYGAQITFGPLPQEAYDCLAAGTHPEDAGIEGPVAELVELLAGFDVELTEDGAFSMGTPVFTLDSKRIGQIADSDAAFGVAAFRDNGLADALRAAGVAYSMTDEGKYEWDPEGEEWRPGMTTPWATTVNQDTSPMLTLHEWDKIKAATGEPERLVAAVDVWLHGLPAIGEPVADETIEILNELLAAVAA